MTRPAPAAPQADPFASWWAAQAVINGNHRDACRVAWDAEAYEAARTFLLFVAPELQTKADTIADACEECGIHEDEAAENVPGLIRWLRRKLDDCEAQCLRGAVAEAMREQNDLRAQLSQLAEHGLGDEFAAHVGCDLVSWLGEALIVARREREEARVDLTRTAVRRARQMERMRFERDKAVREREQLEQRCDPAVLPARAERENALGAVRLLREAEATRDAIEKLSVWMRRMQDRYGISGLYAEGKQYDLGQALVRECYGPKWAEHPPDVPTEEDFARAERWYEGEWPAWAGRPPARLTRGEPTS